MRDRRILFEVTGQGYFPDDMIRYDQCRPVDPDQVLTDAETGYPVRCDEPTTIQMISDKAGKITPDRWLSFGWSVRVLGRADEVMLRKSDPSAECDVCKVWSRTHPSGCLRPGLPLRLI